MCIPIKQGEKLLMTAAILFKVIIGTMAAQAQTDTPTVKKQDSRSVMSSAFSPGHDYFYPVFNTRVPFNTSLLRPKEKTAPLNYSLYRQEKTEKVIIKILGMGALAVFGNNYNYQYHPQIHHP